MIVVLLSNSEMNKERIQLLSETIKRSIDYSVHERIAKDAFRRIIQDPDLELSYERNPNILQSDYTFISKKSGIVTDIYIDKLE